MSAHGTVREKTVKNQSMRYLGAARKGGVLAATAVETQGKAGVLATKAVKGSSERSRKGSKRQQRKVKERQRTAAKSQGKAGNGRVVLVRRDAHVGEVRVELRQVGRQQIVVLQHRNGVCQRTEGNAGAQGKDRWCVLTLRRRAVEGGGRAGDERRGRKRRDGGGERRGREKGGKEEEERGEAGKGSLLRTHHLPELEHLLVLRRQKQGRWRVRLFSEEPQCVGALKAAARRRPGVSVLSVSARSRSTLTRRTCIRNIDLRSDLSSRLASRKKASRGSVYSSSIATMYDMPCPAARRQVSEPSCRGATGRRDVQL